jgi:hypothetical protein
MSGVCSSTVRMRTVAEAHMCASEGRRMRRPGQRRMRRCHERKID